MKKYILSSIILLLAAANTAWGQNVAKIGNQEYSTLQEALDAAETADLEDIVIDLIGDAVLDVTAWSGTQNPYAIGTVNTKTITFNGNGNGNSHTLTFNHKNSDWNNVATMNDAQTKLILNNMNITNSGYNNGPWNRHDINFNCAVELNNVVSDKALAFKNDATLNNVTITENGDVYAIWVQPNTDGQDIDIDGLTINAANGRGIKIDDQYQDTPGNVDLSISNATFTTAKKSAILVKTASTATIDAGENIDITNVADDNDNLVWVDEDRAGDYDHVTVTGSATMVPEGGEDNYVAIIKSGDNVLGYYKTLADAIAAASAGQIITLLDNITLTNTVSIDKGITIDGGNFTVTKASGVAFEVTGAGDVTFTNLKIDATGNDGRAIQAGNSTVKYSGNLTVTNSTLTVGQRGVSIYEPGGNINLAISNTTIQSTVADPTTTYVNADTRGIALWSYDGQSHNVTLEDTDIKGFSYCINVGGTGKINELTMTGGSTYGRAAINNHGKNGTFNLTGVDIHGLNNQTGPTEAFACIVDDTDAANNTYNINNCTITSTISAAASSASGSNASQYLVDLRGTGSTANITNGTTYSTNNTDRGGLIEHYSNLDTHLGNTINFDAATYQTFDAVYDFANVPCLNTTGNTLTYTGEVFYYRSTQSGYQGTYCTFAEPFVSGDLDNGEFIQLQRDVTLTNDITCQLEDGDSFYLDLNGNSITRDANATVPTYIYIDKGVTVYTDVEIDGLLFGLNDCGIAKQDNTDATYKYKYIATDAVAQIDNTIYQTLTDAINAAQGGETILLLSDIGSYDADANPTYTTEAMSTVDNRFNYWINKSITIDGGDNNYSIYVKGRGFGIQGSSANSKIDVTFQNVIVSNVGDANGRCIDTRGNLNSLTLDNVYLTTNESSYTGYLQPLTIGGNQSSPATVTITNSGITTVDEANKGYAITTFNPVNMTITGSEISGWACLNIKGADSSAGSAGSTITVDGGSMTSANGTPGATNAFSLIKIEDDNVNVSVTNCSINVNGGDNTQSIVSFQKLDLTSSENSHVSLGAGNEVILEGDYQFESNTGESSGLEVSGGKFNVRVPMDVIADGLICPTDANTTSDIDDTMPMWELEQGTYVARIGDYGYETLDAAVAALEDNDEIILLDDITLTDAIMCNLEDNEAFALTFGNHTISGGTNNNSILLHAGVTAVTDVQTDIFAAASDGMAVEETVISGGGYSYSVFSPVAQIGTTLYATLEAAIAAVPTDGTATTITMIDNETVAEGVSLTVPATKNIVLDLNGKTVTGSSTTVSPNFYFITNKGTLEITDSSTGASGKITYGCTNPNPGYTNEYVTICNEGGSFTLTKGTIENTSGGLSYAVNNRSVAQGTTTFNLNGGTVSAPSGDAAVRVYQSVYNASSPYDNIVNVTGGTILDNGIFVDSYIGNNVDGSNSHLTVNISGGTVNGLIDYKLRHPYKTSLNITDGTFGNSRFRVRKYTSEWKGSTEPTEPIVTISGGKFTFANGTATSNYAFSLTNGTDQTSWDTYTKPYSVSGGLFTVDLNNYSGIKFPDYYGGVANMDPSTNTDYPYTVGLTSVAKIGTTGYATLEAAVAAAQAGQTIELLTDINLTDPQTINKEVTIDGGTNQYTITSAGNPAAIQIAGAGNITLKNLKVTNEVYNGVQISENANYSGKLTIDNCVITVGKRGVNVVGIASSFSMDITNSTIQSTVADPTTTYLDDIDSRGISLSDNLQQFTVVNINNTIIQGFYDINAADTRKYLNLTMTGGKTYGRAAVNNYGDYNTFTLNGVEIHGLNNQTNPAQSFACIVDNTYATNNTYNIIGCTFTATISDAAINEDNSKASEQMLALRGTNAKVNITSNTTYTTTCTDKSRVGLLEDESRVADPTYNNIVTLDADALSSLTGVINDLTTLVAEYDGQSKYKLVPGSPSTVVAKIGDTEYTTLEEAFAAVQNGETITMLTDYTLAAPMDLTLEGKVVTLDLGGKTLTGRTNLKSGNLTIQNGTVAGGEQQALNVYGSATAGTQNYSVLTIASNVTVTADQFGVCMFGPTYNSKPGYGAVINIAGTVHTTGTGAEGAVFVSGNLGNNIDGDMNNVINVTGTITSDTDAAIALNGNATVYVQNGAVITGNTAIAIKRGTLNVTGGTVHATGISQIPPSGNLNGTEMTGAAVSMTNTYNQYGAMQVNISGGSFTSDHAMALYKEDDNYTNTAKYAVSGGIFSTAVPEEFCADGYVPTSITTQGLTQYTVEPGDFVAQIGETKYTTLAAAVAAVPTNGLETTITLLKDITLVNNVVVGGTYGTTPKVTTAITNQNVILNLDGHTITGEKTLYLAGGSLNITGTGSIISTSPDVAPVGVRYVKTDNYPDLDYTSKRTLTIGKNVTLTGAQYGLNIFGTNEASKANNIDVTVDGTVNGMLFVLGNISNANNNINIDVNGTVDATNATGSEMVKTGIALGGNATVNVNNGATVKGESGIEVRAGNLTVNGGTIEATSADYSYTANNNGMTTKGAAIAIAQHGTLVATSATILGGATLDGTKKIAVIDAQNNSLAGVTVIADDGYLDNSDTETVLPDGYYWLSNGDGTSSPAPNSAVAQIGNTLYSTLAAAVAAVPADGTPTTITLLQNINLTERLFVNAGATPAYAGSNNRYATTTENKNITLELDGHNIVSSSNIALAGGSLNITNNGTADATHGVISTTAGGLAPIEVRGTGDLTKKRTLTIGTGVTLSGNHYGLNVFGSNDAQKNTIDVNVDGTVNGILFVLGNLKNADNEININVNGTVDASNSTGNSPKTGIALNGNANVTVNNGAAVTGESGIEVRAGQLTVNGGTITGTATTYSYTPNGSGTTTMGAAVAVAQHTTNLPVAVQLNGGTLVGTELIAVTDVNNNGLEGVSVTAKASFVENTDTKLPDGFIWVNNGNGTYYIGVAPVQIIHVDNTIDSYATLVEAFNSVADIETIKLIADVALTEDVTLNKPFKLDFNNHTINLNGHTIKLVQGETIKTNKQTNIFTAADNNYIITVEDSNDPDFPYAYSEKININTANFTVTVTPVTYDGLNHKIGGQNPVTVKIYDVDGQNELDPDNFEISMLPYTSYDAADFHNREEDVYKDAYTYINAITIKGKPEAGYAGSITVDFVIYPRDINDVTVEGQCQPYTETGYTADDNATTGIKKLVTLKYNNIPLVASTANTIGDYTIDVDATNTYKDTGTYPEAITLTAVEGGNFTGTRKVDFVIGGDKDIATSNITATVIYTGSRQEPTGAGTTPTVIVKDGLTNAVLAQGTDYLLEYDNTYGYKDAQTYSNAVTIRGIGDYHGVKTIDYIITPKNIADCTINASTTFTNSVINPADAVQVSDPGLSADPPGNQLLAKGTDYTLTVSNGYTYLNPQTYANAITVTGTGNYTGTVTMDFTITNDNGAIDITEAGMVESYVIFTGKNQPPSKGRLIVSVKNPTTGEKKTLVYNQDYTFTFNGVAADYYDAKTYSHAVTITGIGNYYGSFTADYVISPRELTERYIVCEAVDPLVWTGTELKLNVNNQISGRTDNNVILKLVNTEADPANNIPEDAYMLSSASDYTYTTEPVTMKDPGEYVVTFTGRYNFTGKRTVTVKVTKDINLLADDDIEIPVQILGSVTPNIRPSNIQDMVVTDGDNVLEQGTHYTLTFTDGTTTYQGGAGPYITQQGKYTAIITGKDPYYSGEKRKDFVVVNEYYTYNAPETGEEFAVHITSGKNLTATVGAKTGAAIATDGTSLTLPSTIDVTVPNASPETFTLNGIENGAFAGCDKLRYIDATAMSGYVPETLTRDFDGPFNGLPKQALVYLTGTNIKGENYVYKPGSGDAYYCELFKIYDDLNGSQTGFDGNDYKWAFENVHKFTAYTVENTRMLTAGKHYTTCLPYSIDIPRNVKAYTLDATSGQIFGFKEIPGSTIEAYTPYVLIPSTSGQLLSATDVEVDKFPADATPDATKLKGVNPANSNFTFYGTMRYMEGADAAGKYIMQYKDNKSTWLSIDEGTAGFNESNRACILPMRAYIASTTGGARSFTATFTDIDGIIRTETFTLDDEDTVIYDLSGRRVELLEHGHTYIINGKKVIVK